MAKYPLILLFFFVSFQVTSQDILESIPMQFVENYIFIKVKINDNEKPLNFLFDTGAGITVVETKVAEQLLLEINAESNISTSGKSLLSKESTSNRVRIGRRTILDNVDLILLDLSHLSEYLDTNVDGVIGYDLLNEFVTETNIDKREIRFYNPQTFSYKGENQPIKLTNLESNLFGLIVDVMPRKGDNTIELNFQIDTGYDDSLLFHNATVMKYGLIRNKKKQKIKKGFGADSTIVKNIQTKIKYLSFSAQEWRNVPALLEVDPINKRENSLAQGIIGQELLLDFNIIYNLKNRVAYFEKRK